MPKMTEYLTAVSRKRLICADLSVCNCLIEGILKQAVDNYAKTQEVKDEIYNVRRTVLVCNDIALFTHFVRPDEAVNSAGYKNKYITQSSACIVSSARRLIYLVGKHDKPINIVDTAGNERKNDRKYYRSSFYSVHKKPPEIIFMLLLYIPKSSLSSIFITKPIGF
jgi:hypothetical protein